MGRIITQVSSATKGLWDFTDTVSPLSDKSGNGNNAIIPASPNNPTLVNSGRFGNAYSIVPNNYISLPVNTDTRPTSDCTIISVVKVRSLSGVHPIYWTRGANPTVLAGLFNYIGAGKFITQFSGNSTSPDVSNINSISLVLNNYYLLVSVIKPNVSITSYVNGIKNVVTNFPYALSYNSSYVLIGAGDAPTFVYYANNQVDFLQIEHRAWSDGEIIDFYKNNFDKKIK